MPEVIGYGDRLTVRPGERLRLHVGATGLASTNEIGGATRDVVAYDVDVVRLRCADLQPGGAGLSEERIPSAIDGHHAARAGRLPSSWRFRRAGEAACMPCA